MGSNLLLCSLGDLDIVNVPVNLFWDLVYITANPNGFCHLYTRGTTRSCYAVNYFIVFVGFFNELNCWL